MFKLLSKFGPYKKIQDLTIENEALREKLEERQEAINKTNAYWKKKFHDTRRKQSEVKL